jgi:hypothetical protein
MKKVKRPAFAYGTIHALSRNAGMFHLSPMVSWKGFCSSDDLVESTFFFC